jgi:fluoroquinolone transport system ATP-binding protein
MFDATELCDRVAFIVDGEIRALDTPRNLIMRRGASKITYTYLSGGRE